MTARQARMKRELEMLATDPPPGVAAWMKDDNLNVLEAQIDGPDDTPYAKGIFKLEVIVPDRYPFEPPRIRFITPIYHPNIDSGGLICLNTLNLPPKGVWTPSLNIPAVLTTIHQLMADPNPDDGLMVEITTEYRNNRLQFLEKARRCTQQFAIPSATPSTTIKPATTATTTTTVTAFAAPGAAAKVPQARTHVLLDSSDEEEETPLKRLKS
eukprot:TRINITY_DN2505_c0_g1_i1.p1 TRINITY_DN2505_c0_g1~~TRINITY_DN2505_c0_g1_i1.p1  ORF type:complete len:212 (+),score=42.95 TRINITY_DN2505_c0_g1_i1:301-936(+)